MAGYDLSPEALADLLDIADYTKRKWGIEQAAKYRNQLEDCAEAIAVGKDRPRDLSHIKPGLRSIRCQQHYIYFVRMEDMTARIVAILHEQMDLMARIAERLK
jgi:toxin ParE1/3/4